jgi:F-type H+-transporting ATPase subunit b
MKRSLLSVIVLALALLVGRYVHAQPTPEADGRPTEEPANGTAEAREEGEEDPSRHFNYTNFGGWWQGQDEWGGKYGDGEMTAKDAHGKPFAVHEEEKMSPPFVLALINFGLLLGLLAWKGRPAVRKLAEERHDQIKTALDDAAKLRKQAADRLADYEKRLAAADGEMKKLVDGIRADAEADKARILKAAEEQAVQLKRDAESRIAAEIEAARAALTQEVTAAAAKATEKILRDKTTTGDHDKLVGNFISDVQHQAIRKDAR